MKLQKEMMIMLLSMLEGKISPSSHPSSYQDHKITQNIDGLKIYVIELWMNIRYHLICIESW